MFYVFAVYFVLIFLCKAFICCASSVQDNIDPCPIIREQFAAATSEFTSCSITNSQPITFCETCVESYLNIVNAYSNMSKQIYDNETSETCLDRFINLDRLQIVQTQYTNNVDLWKRGKCDECYISNNGLPTPTISNDTNTFLKYFNIYQNCTKDFNSTKDLCTKCMEYYMTLHDYYLGISNSNDKISMCIDLVDLMNRTWTFWSDNCCTYRRHNEYIFIISTVGVFILTICFYVVVKFCAEKRIPTIVQQTRFAESVGSFST